MSLPSQTIPSTHQQKVWNEFFGYANNLKKSVKFIPSNQQSKTYQQSSQHDKKYHEIKDAKKDEKSVTNKDEKHINIKKNSSYTFAGKKYADEDNEYDNKDFWDMSDEQLQERAEWIKKLKNRYLEMKQLQTLTISDDMYGYKFVGENGQGSSGSNYKLKNRYSIGGPISLCENALHFLLKPKARVELISHLPQPFRLFKVKIPKESIVVSDCDDDEEHNNRRSPTFCPKCLYEGNEGSPYKLGTNDLIILEELPQNEIQVFNGFVFYKGASKDLFPENINDHVQYVKKSS